VQLIADSDIQLWFIAYFFDIGHSCYGQLTPVKTRYPLISNTLPYWAMSRTSDFSGFPLEFELEKKFKNLIHTMPSANVLPTTPEHEAT